jgi:hypothetical protein
MSRAHARKAEGPWVETPPCTDDGLPFGLLLTSGHLADASIQSDLTYICADCLQVPPQALPHQREQV